MGYLVIRSVLMLPVLVLITIIMDATWAQDKTHGVPKDPSAVSGAGYYYNRRTPYGFGYRFSDEKGNLQERQEETKPGGSKSGSYSYVDPNGIYRKVEYVADDRGFRATVRTNEPGVEEENPANVRIVKHPYEIQNSFSDFSEVNAVDDGYFSTNRNTNGFFSGNKRLVAAPLPSGDHQPYVGNFARVFGANGAVSQDYSTNTYSSSGSTSYYSSEEMDEDLPKTKTRTYYSSSGKQFGGSSSYQDQSRFFGSGFHDAPDRTFRRPGAKAKRRKRQRNYGNRLNSVVKIHVPFGVEDSHLIPVYRDR